MSWVASALPANRMSTKPASTRATIAGAAPVWTTAGPPTQRILRPSSLMSRICWAIWRTSSACGFSEETSDFMNSKPPALRSIAGSGTTFTPLAPHTSWSPLRTSLTAIVRARSPLTTIPQSISGFSTGTQVPPSRTTVSRLVVE